MTPIPSYEKAVTYRLFGKVGIFLRFGRAWLGAKGWLREVSSGSERSRHELSDAMRRPVASPRALLQRISEGRQQRGQCQTRSGAPQLEVQRAAGDA